MKKTAIITEEGDLPYPQCPQCDMLETLADINGQNPNTAQWTKGKEGNRCRLEVEEVRAGIERSCR